MSLRRAWQKRGIEVRLGTGVKLSPEKPRTRPWDEVFPIIVMRKSCGECEVDFCSADLFMIPELFLSSVGLSTGSLASSD